MFIPAAKAACDARSGHDATSRGRAARRLRARWQLVVKTAREEAARDAVEVIKVAKAMGLPSNVSGTPTLGVCTSRT